MYIKREDAMEVIYKLDLCLTNLEYFAHNDLMRAIPAADVVEVVRCKDCEDSRPLKRERLPESIFRKECVWCRRFNTGMLPDGYCSYGKRKMDKEE